MKKPYKYNDYYKIIRYLCGEFIIDAPRPVLRVSAGQTVKARNRKAYKK